MGSRQGSFLNESVDSRSYPKSEFYFINYYFLFYFILSEFSKILRIRVQFAKQNDSTVLPNEHHSALSELVANYCYYNCSPGIVTAAPSTCREFPCDVFIVEGTIAKLRPRFSLTKIIPLLSPKFSPTRTMIFFENRGGSTRF